MSIKDCSNSELHALKRARRLLRICEIAAGKTDEEREHHLRRACFGDPQLLDEAIRIVASVQSGGGSLRDLDLFPSLPPGRRK